MGRLKAMATKELGQVDPAGNFNLGVDGAVKLREWAAKRTKEIEANPNIPRRHRADAEWRAYLDAKYPHGLKDGQTWAVKDIERPVLPYTPLMVSRAVTESVTVTPSERDSVTPERDIAKAKRDIAGQESPGDRRKRLARERKAKERERKRKE